MGGVRRIVDGRRISALQGLYWCVRMRVRVRVRRRSEGEGVDGGKQVIPFYSPRTSTLRD